MSYDFWDYFWGALILACFALPILGLIAFKLFIILAFWFANISGAGYKVSERGSTTIRFNANDYDEDN